MKSNGTTVSDGKQRLDADIFVPQGGLRTDEVAHEADAFGVLENFDLDSVAAHMVLGAEKGPVLADDDAGDFVEDDGAAAHRAGRERGIHRRALVNGGGEAAGVAQAVHFAMVDGAAGLDAAVVALADDFAVADQDGTDRDAAFGEARAGLRDGGFEEWVFSFHLFTFTRVPEMAADARGFTQMENIYLSVGVDYLNDSAIAFCNCSCCCCYGCAAA